jgi:hypothetical protein
MRASKDQESNPTAEWRGGAARISKFELRNSNFHCPPLASNELFGDGFQRGLASVTG